MRENFIKLIATCNNKDVRRNWIIELSNMENIECSESQCDSCIIREECLDTLMSKAYNDEELVNFTPECIECKVTIHDASHLCNNCKTLKVYYGGC